MGRGDFISLENMKQLIEIMRSFFKDNYEFDLQVDSELKKLMLHAMNDVESKHKGLPIKERNRMLLHVMRDVVIKKFQLDTNANPATPLAKLGRMRDPPLTSAEDASSLGSRLERLEQLRTENKERIPRFEDVHNALDETAMNATSSNGVFKPCSRSVSRWRVPPRRRRRSNFPPPRRRRRRW